ncbi:lysine--tRNA ligase [Cardinium endosymbiont of Culicoides punctatus]|uniref:lysine--tRNA ligase n=1 Tax=Cardinium endosymbiont of Culicoides punctatus TaxID=2304601 RepID=UPI00105903EF|nr:lysine--tRNA ligase [Cardinium endosymbiont of Culicoides punctatus]TDG95741.1 Lysine--tRNA ligase, heat inducible [Cardinium endosymbiont of Culicoides punctatus]
MHQLSEQEIIRTQKKAAIEAMGILPYPASVNAINVKASTILANYKEENKEDYSHVILAGRIMSRRIMGAASFVELQDATGRIQLYVQRDAIAPDEDKSYYNVFFKKLLDIGDIIEVQGFVFTTQVGAIAVHVTHLRLLTKALTPLPIVKEAVTKEGIQTYDAFTDSEQRYRQRYVDLIVNPDVRKVFEQRTKLIDTIKYTLNQQGYLEVETPILQPIYGGASARPFKTHHNALDIPLYLRISNELYLKRLIIGGYDGVYEFAKDFRNEGMSRFHNPEFTQVELYVAYKDYIWMMDFMEQLIETVALALHGTTTIQVGAHTINFQRPWKRFTMFEAIQHFTGHDVSNMDEQALRTIAHQLHISLEDNIAKGKIIDEIFGEKCEPYLIQPTFITDYPVEMSPLAKRHRDNPSLTERFEVICNGKEICNAFSELNDPIDQQQRLEEQRSLGERGDEEAMVVDHDFLKALRYGMPPTVGVGIGIDRLTMIMTNVHSIQDVIFFPQMRPEHQ